MPRSNIRLAKQLNGSLVTPTSLALTNPLDSSHPPLSRESWNIQDPLWLYALDSQVMLLLASTLPAFITVYLIYTTASVGNPYKQPNMSLWPACFTLLYRGIPPVIIKLSLIFNHQERRWGSRKLFGSITGMCQTMVARGTARKGGSWMTLGAEGVTFHQ